ncbi:MAG: N-acetylmuramidase family protein, partial [Desulfovibrio sp.]|nr:N-acetylmuramidase family protein [Desulfovibrio sp.]
QYPDIVYPAWTKTHDRGGSGVWERLHTAMKVHKEAALCSASYGLLQIMGFNHALCGFDTVQAFVEAQEESEAKQLESFCAFMRSEGLVPFLSRRDWTGFARRYNGPGYAQNQYDVKLRKAYEQCRATS